MKFRPERLPYYISVMIKLWRAMNPENRIGEVISWFGKGKTVSLKRKNVTLVFGKLTDLLEIKEAVLDDEYQASKFKGGTKLVVDIGAGVGDFSVMTAKRLPRAMVMAYEPDPVRFNLLSENIKINKLKNIIPVKKYIHNLKEVLAQVTGQVDVIKLDCEGGEHPIILHSKSEELRRFDKIVMEYHLTLNGQLKKLIDKLEESSFKVECEPNQDVGHLGHITATRKLGSA